MWWRMLGIDATVSGSLVAEIPIARASLDLAEYEEGIDFGDSEVL